MRRPPVVALARLAADAPSVVIDGHRMRYLGRGQVRADFPATGIRIAPPTKDAVIGWTEAAQACFRPQLGCILHDDASITLVDATIDGRTFLMYAVAWDAVDCASLGPADPEGSSGSCRQVDLVGAGGETPGTAGVHAFTVVGDAVTTRAM